MYYLVLLLALNAQAWTVADLRLPKDATPLASTSTMPKQTFRSGKKVQAYTPPTRIDARLSNNTPTLTYAKFITMAKWKAETVLPKCKINLEKLGYVFIKKTATRNSETIIAEYKDTKERVLIHSKQHPGGKRILQLMHENEKLLALENYASLLKLFTQ